ncbi:hypothetical protein [Micromonospora sp. HM5-17]|uniref:hypothetical protein n=1 Tax=Micromonospora sp. HM5-17 TaxID=2487710 RepID=UPI000F48934C|nr:hypothetical protein [Micromonospora sp. HM5-17]ROT31665.1 hypothetical protein EF879_14750 [Micromonospora sp. HM5-17]
MEAAELRRAYDDLLTEVTAGGFGPPPPGGLTAEQVVAHLAANDELMIEATEAVLAGSPWTYYDAQSTLPPQVDAMAVHPAGLSGLVAWLQTTSGRLCALLDRLGPAAETPVECHLREGTALAVEESLPWGRMLDIHGRIHLAIHREELRALRPTTR